MKYSVILTNGNKVITSEHDVCALRQESASRALSRPRSPINVAHALANKLFSCSELVAADDVRAKRGALLVLKCAKFRHLEIIQYNSYLRLTS